MTIASAVSKVTLNGNGSTTSFPFGFKVWKAADLEVSITDASGNVATTTSWSVVLNPSGGGTVTYPLTGSPLPSGHKITIARSMDFLQDVDLVSGTRWDPEVVETALDRATAERQQLKERLDRAVAIPISSSTTPEQFADDLFSARDAAVASAASAATSAATAGTKVTEAAASAADAEETLKDFRNIYYGSRSSDPTTRPDGSATQDGDLYKNTATTTLRVYDAASGIWGYVSTGSVSFKSFTATEGQTEFELDIAPAAERYVEVYIGTTGRQPPTAYTVDGTTLTLSEGVSAGTIVDTYVNSVSNIGTPSDGTVTRAKLAAAIESAVPVSVKEFGATGDGVTDDAAAIVNALTAAAGRTVVLESGKTYLIGSAIVFNGDVSIRSDGADKAVIFHNGQSFNPITVQGTLAATTTLSASQQVNNRGWSVTSATGIQPGMLMEVMSSASWYHDPRPATTDARKSELHRVASVSGTTVFTEDPANDGYNVPTETVTVKFYTPVSVRMENIVVRCVLPAPAVDAPRVTGIQLRYANEPVLVDVDVENAANAGIFLEECYRPVVERGHTHGANNHSSGYGVHTFGCAHTLVRDRTFWQCRRGVDISGRQIISRHSTIENCTNLGGGVDSEGTVYGFFADGSLGSPQYGFGSHGPADHTIYRSNRVANMWNGFLLRGRNEIVENNYYVGRSYTGVITANFGENVWVTGNKVYEGWSTLKDGTIRAGNIPAVTLSVGTVSGSIAATVNGPGQTTAQIQVGAVITGNAAIPAGTFVVRIVNDTEFLLSANATITQTEPNTTFTADNSRRADWFFHVAVSHSGGKIVVKDNDVEIRDRFLSFGGGSTAVKAGMQISGNKIRFSRSPNTQEVFFAFNSDAAAFATNWKLFNNDYQRDDGGSGAVTRFRQVTDAATTQFAERIYSGTYTPTATGVTNITAVTPSVCQYSVVGNTVTVSGRVAIYPTTANTSTSLRLSLPVAAPNLSAIQLAGTGQTLLSEMPFSISGDATNREALIAGIPTVNANRHFYFHFTYWIA